jgi:beta-lactam-binding protein with PASTA domain
MKRFFNLLLGALAMLAVALISAYLAMRIAIHGREVEVPNLAGLTVSDAARQANSRGLSMKIENRFYSPDIPLGHILSQSPAPGSVVRREWAVRITESLGPQKVSIPKLVGQTERPATINMRQLSLELGTIAHLEAPGPPGVVLAQTPTPAAEGVDRPQVSLLLSGLQDTAPTQAYVMPSLIGLTLANAAARASASGLHIVSAEDLNNAPTPTPSATPASPASTTTPPAASTTPASAISPATVVFQTPPAGHRVVQGDPVKITLGH